MLLFEFIYFPQVKSVYNHIKYKNVLKQEQYLLVYIKMWMEIAEAKKAYFRTFCEMPGIFRVYFRIFIFESWKHCSIYTCCL